MKQQMKKQKWIKPELIVLTRKKPDDAVLGMMQMGGCGAPSQDNWFSDSNTKR